MCIVPLQYEPEEARFMTPRESVVHMEDDCYQVRMLVKQTMDISYILGLQSLSDV